MVFNRIKKPVNRTEEIAVKLTRSKEFKMAITENDKLFALKLKFPTLLPEEQEHVLKKINEIQNKEDNKFVETTMFETVTKIQENMNQRMDFVETKLKEIADKLEENKVATFKLLTSINNYLATIANKRIDTHKQQEQKTQAKNK